jgi:hypothetical protein
MINGNLINWESPEMRGLTTWLTKVFEERIDDFLKEL